MGTVSNFYIKQTNVRTEIRFDDVTLKTGEPPQSRKYMQFTSLPVTYWAKYLFKLYLHELKFIIFLLTRVQGC